MLVSEHDTTDSLVDRHNIISIRNHPRFNNENAGKYKILVIKVWYELKNKFLNVVFSTFVPDFCKFYSSLSLGLKNLNLHTCISLDYDFSILTLATIITFSSTVAPVCLPGSTQSLYTGQVATVTGWGATSSDGISSPTLQKVDVTVVSNEKCKDYYPGKIKRLDLKIVSITLNNLWSPK